MNSTIFQQQFRINSSFVSTGHTVRYLLRWYNLTQQELANHLGVSRCTINELCQHRRSMTPEMALRLGKATDTDPAVWLQIEAQEALKKIRSRRDSVINDLKHIKKLHRF